MRCLWNCLKKFMNTTIFSHKLMFLSVPKTSFEPLCLLATVSQKQTKCCSLRQFDFQTFKHQYISNKGISCFFWFYSNVLHSHLSIFFICHVHFANLFKKSISFLTQIIKFSFRTTEKSVWNPQLKSTENQSPFCASKFI